MRCTTLILIALVLGGCATAAGTADLARNTHRAEQLTRQAAGLIDADPDRAEAMLRQALEADLFHGPAHNNLGVIHERRGNLYEAATEFEAARKLMPGHPDPRLNLALILEQVGRFEEAIDTYQTALEVHPGHLPTMQALARCQLRHARTNESTADYLDEIALSGNAEWREWARLQRAKLGR